MDFLTHRLSRVQPIWILVLIGVILVGGVWVRGRQSAQPLSISLVDPRPVAQAVELLEARYGWTITYEDPPYEHDAEIEDVTISVRKDGKTEPKVIVPRAGLLNYTYNDSQAPADPAIILPGLITEHRNNSLGSFFRVTQSSGVFHVVPAGLKNRAGEIVWQRSILETKVSLTERDRTASEAVDAILEEVSKTIGRKVGFASGPTNLLNQTRVRGAIAQESAESALTQILQATGQPLSWQLFYSPSLKAYFFNVHGVLKPTR